MVKIIVMLKRKSSMTMEEFSQYWYEEHGPLALRIMPGLRKYTQNHAVRLTDSEEPRFDGIAELWFDDLESRHKFLGWYWGDEGKVLRDDEEKFIDRSKMFGSIVDERVIKP